MMVLQEVEIAVRTSERPRLMHSRLQGHAGNVMIDRLTETGVMNGLVEDQPPNRLKQLAVCFRRLSDLVFIVFQGLAGFFMPRGQADIKDVNTLVCQVDQRLLQQ
jgi:hypothetical protein